eukprot:5266208-Amphidinium_carterae.1
MKKLAPTFAGRVQESAAKTFFQALLQKTSPLGVLPCEFTVLGAGSAHWRARTHEHVDTRGARDNSASGSSG